jgi:hypothetical protein
MLKSFYDGHLDVAKWLKAARAAKIFETRTSAAILSC